MFIKYISIVGGLIVSSLVAYLSRKRVLNDKTFSKNSNGYYIMRLKSHNELIIYFTFCASIVAFIYGFIDSELSVSDKLLIYFLGLFFVFMGILLLFITMKNRIEYNDEEIKQFIVFRQTPKIIRWDDDINIKFHEIGPLLEFSNKDIKLYINFRNNGFIEFLNFSFLKLSDENCRLLKSVLENK